MIPVSLKLENFMSHARSELDFSQFDAALVMGAHNDDLDVSNGVGKTAIFDAILWSLFNKCRFRKLDKVIRRGSPSARVEFVFEMEGKTYRVDRRISTRGSAEVSFHLKAGDSWEQAEDLGGDTATMTNRRILEIVRLSHDTFINSVYFKQNDIARFASATAGQRKEILKEVLNIGVWDRFQDVAKSRSRKLKDQAAELADRIRSLGDLDRELDDNAQSMGALELEMQSCRSRLEAKEAALDDAKERLRSAEAALAKVSGEEVAGIRRRLGQISSRSREILARRDVIRKEARQNTEEAEKAAAEFDRLAEELPSLAGAVAKVKQHGSRSSALEILGSDPEPSGDRETVAALEKALSALRAKAATLQLQLRQLTALEPGGECPTCLSEIGDVEMVLRSRSRRQEELERLIAQHEDAEKDVMRDLDEQASLFAAADSAALGMERLKLNMARAEERQAAAEKANARLKDELGLLAREWSDLAAEKETLAERLEGLGDAEELKKKTEEAAQETNLLGTEVAALRRRQMEVGVSYGSLQGHAEDLKRRVSEKNALEARHAVLLQDLDTHRRLAKAFGKDGVQAIIMENVTEDLRNYANSVLRRVCRTPMSLDFVTQHQTGSGSWTETFDIRVAMDGDQADFEDLSGGEQVRVSIALRLALSRLLMRRVGSTVRFLLLDEVDQALDRQGMQSLAATINALSQEFKILVITHNDSMKDRFDHLIVVQKGPHGSIVEQQ